MSSRLWRWLTCGHGLHDWQFGAALDLVGKTFEVGPHSGPIWLYASRSCPRCGTVKVLK